ncbi:MAG: VWA domain-containing protein [Acidobacteria bacterium]|nr:VWA domain-containing protein [Acidobacteriota bacterium]MBV9476818.1 VWA domain-containing protein [Acidobacteriota bacterium]
MTLFAVLCVLPMMTATAFAQSALPPLSKQDIVFVIDNSSSMGGPTGSDPLSLRGVAASLILDAVELASDVQAGVVFFSDGTTTDGRLHPPDEIRRRLQAGRLPVAAGGTNMAAGLDDALTILATSKASLRRIVLISDGMPTTSTPITSAIVPHAVAAGIQIFALGVTTNIDQRFLDTLTLPTGGRTLIAKQHQELLQKAKELVGNLDNIYPLDGGTLASNVTEHEFTVPPGVDRARLTLILDHPTEFAPGEIDFSLTGSTFSEQRYTVEPEGVPRIAAWTAFFSAPGHYRLQIRVTRPGAQGHLGLRFFMEALSNLRVAIKAAPEQPQYLFNQQVAIDVVAVTASGPVAATDAKVSGEVQTAAGGSTAIAFNNFRGTFNVPATPGKHKVIVHVELPALMNRAEARIEYLAVQEPPPILRASPENFAFDPPLSAAHPDVEESFKVFAEFAQGTPSRPEAASFTWSVPAGIGKLTANGSEIRPAPARYTIPPGGLELHLRLTMDPSRPLPKPGKYPGSIIVSTNDAPSLTIPFTVEVSVPKFVLAHERKSFALWWDPSKTRSVRLGTLQTNLSAASQFTVTIPEAITDPLTGKIADLALNVNGESLEGEPFESGKLRYGPVDLPPGGGAHLDLVVTPDPNSGWSTHPIRRELQIHIASDLGMTLEPKPVFHNPRPLTLPLLGKLTLHGVIVASAMFLLLGSLVVALRTWGQSNLVKRFWRFQTGRFVPLGFGPIAIGDGDAAGALLLPKHGSELDDTTVGTVTRAGHQQYLNDTSGYLTPPQSKLAPGDVIRILDPADIDRSVWEFEYVQYDPATSGEVVVQTSPGWSLGRLLKNLAVSALILWALHAALHTDFASHLAYYMPFDWLYTR